MPASAKSRAGAALGDGGERLAEDGTLAVAVEQSSWLVSRAVCPLSWNAGLAASPNGSRMRQQVTNGTKAYGNRANVSLSFVSRFSSERK